MKKAVTFALAAVLCALAATLFCACNGDGNEEITTKIYKYDFAVASVNYTYELGVDTETSSANLTLKQGEVTLHNFYDLSISAESATVYKIICGSANAEFELKSDDTFVVSSASGTIPDLILGYGFFAGDYGVNIGGDALQIALTDDGTAHIGNDVSSFLPWNGANILMIADKTYICSVNLSDKTLAVAGYATDGADYIFDSEDYRIDDLSPYGGNKIDTALYLEKDGNKARLQAFYESGESEGLSDVYFGTYVRDANGKITISYNENETLELIVENAFFDFYYDYYSNGDKWLKLYGERGQAVYNYEAGYGYFDLISSGDGQFILGGMSSDEVEMTLVVDSALLALNEIYFGDFKGLSGAVYTDVSGSKLVIADSETAYTHSYMAKEDRTQADVYYVQKYAEYYFDSKVISVQDGSVYYYLDGATFYNLQAPSTEERAQFATEEGTEYSGKNLTYGNENQNTADALTFTVCGATASFVIYDINSEYGSCYIATAVKNEFTLADNVYTVSDGETNYRITVTDGAVTALSITPVT